MVVVVDEITVVYNSDGIESPLKGCYYQGNVQWCAGLSL